MNRAKKLIESVESMRMDEALRTTKKKLREVLDKDGEKGSRGMRALMEIGLERSDMMMNEQDDRAPNPAADSDMKLMKEAQRKMKEAGKKLKSIKEVNVGTKPEERPKDKQIDMGNPEAAKTGKAFQGSKKVDMGKKFPKSKANV